jgi:hypothetical protein
MRSAALALTLTLLFSGCVTPISFAQAKERVLLRASFEFACPPDKLSVQELASDGQGPVYLGVSGCTRRAVYVRLDSAGGALYLNDTAPLNTEPAKFEGSP